MADKPKLQPLVGAKPVPMKLFATWEVDRTPHDCIPRLCSLTLSRLIVLKPLGPDVSSISVAVKMQGSKRTLRSNEMVLPTNGLLETELQLHFSLQYPHFLKRDGNKLHVMLQRRKRYKNRTILGYKTLADGIINMSLVLQRQLDLELDLLNDGKESKGHNCLVAKVSVNSLNSQPVDSEGTTKSPHNTRDFSDEDEEFSSNEDGSDSEPMIEDGRVRGPRNIPTSARQRNLKQKFVSLLKRFRVNEDLHGLDADREVISSKLSGGEMDPADIEDLFKELELSDSGQEMDTMSISSTPKPSLRPFFSSSRSLFHETFSVPGRLVTHGHSLVDVPEPPLAERTIEKTGEESCKIADSDSHPDSDNPPPNGSPLKNPDEKARKVVEETLTRILLSDSDDFLPDHLLIVNTGDSLGPLVAAQLQENNHKLVCTSNGADVKATIAFIVNKIQKFCNTSAKPPSVMKVLLAGSDSFLNLVLRSYVDQLSAKPPDWQAYLRFLVVPLGTNTVSRYLGTLDSVYHAAFVGDTWKEAIEKADTNELVNRIQKYLQQASTTVNLPIAEAMLTYKEKSSDDESSQIFIPFMTDVKLGSDVISSASIEIDDNLSSNISSSGSPPVSSCLDRKITPPSSPNMNTFVTVQSKEISEPLELQIDYWILSTKTPENKLDGGNKNKVESLKSTLKCTFRSLQVLRLSGTGELPTPHFTLSYSTKEKKQKIMRLGKKKEKEKDNDSKNQTIDGVIRLICSTKTPSAPLKLYIDGIEWSGVKFFQLSSQWQTHIRSFPVSLFVHNDSL